MKYRLSLAAEADILQLYAASLLDFGPAQADAYHAGLTQTFEFLAQFPRAARERLEVTPPVRVHPYRSHVIIYVADAHGVLILRVRHAREDWEHSPT